MKAFAKVKAQFEDMNTAPWEQNFISIRTVRQPGWRGPGTAISALLDELSTLIVYDQKEKRSFQVDARS